MSEKKSKYPDQTRDHNFDLLRIVATVAVILIHANFIFFGNRYAEPDGSLIWTIESLFNIITRFSVPVFVMISGAYNIDKGRGIDFYIKTSYKVFLPMFVIILLMLSVSIALHPQSASGLLMTLLLGQYNNLWYLFMLAGLYLLTPLLSLMKRTITEKQYRIVAILLMFWSIVSQATSTQKLSYSIGVVVAFVAYYVLGDVLFEFVKRHKNYGRLRAEMTILALLGVLLAYIVRRNGFNYYIEQPYINFFSPAIVLYSVAIFVYTGTVSVKKDFSWLSRQTFYIYIFHTPILTILRNVIHISELPAIFVYTVLTFLIALVVTVLFDQVWSTICDRTGLFEKWKKLYLWRFLSGK